VGFQLVGVFGSLGLCINVRDADVNYAVSPASPKASNQDVATVFRAIVLDQVFDCWAVLPLRGHLLLCSTTVVDSWFVVNCGGKKGL
jgi:hypothetical protein